MEESDKWFREAFKSYEQMLSVFGNISNPQKVEKDWPDFAQFWEKTFQQTMDLFQSFPQADYLAAVQKCDSLEKTIADQQQTIHYLNTLLEQKGSPASPVTEEFKDLLTKQQAEFEKLANAVNLFSKEKKAPVSKKP